VYRGQDTSLLSVGLESGMSGIRTEHCGSAGNASVLRSGGTQLEFWPGHRLFRPKSFVVSIYSVCVCVCVCMGGGIIYVE
jgi:hypothetical protein